MENIIEELKKDIEYFKSLGFDELANKFSRDLHFIEKLSKKREGDSNAGQDVVTPQ